MLNQD